MNEVLLVVEVVACFTSVVAITKVFGRQGLFVWMAIATILANLTTAKSVAYFGVDATLGTVLFCSVFLASDVLNERYGREVAARGVVFATIAAGAFIVAAFVANLYIPSEIDVASESMQLLFGLNIRINIASIVMFFISNIANVYLYSVIRKKTNGRFLWLRNNVSSILCNCLENFLFMFLAFYGVYGIMDVLIIAATTSVIEITVGLLDTPFMYWASKEKVARKATQAEA